MKNWGRLITAMATPLHPDGSVNYEQSVKFAQYLIDTGTTGLVVVGTTGESPTIKADERLQLFKTIKQNVSVPVIAGVGTNDTAATIENARRAEDCGVDGLLAVVPYYNKPNQDCLYAHFAALNDAVSTPIMMYNVPGRTGCNMSAATSVALSKLKNICSLKEASGDLVQLSTVVRDCAEGFLVYTGEDAQILPTLAVGGYGVVSVASQVVGRDISAMIDSYLKGDAAKAGELHRKLIDICTKLFLTANPIPVKAALNLLGQNVGGLRLPLLEASAELVDILKEELVKLRLL